MAIRRDGEFYAVPTVAGAGAVAIAWEFNAAAVFGVRGLALHLNWRGPHAWKR